MSEPSQNTSIDATKKPVEEPKELTKSRVVRGTSEIEPPEARYNTRLDDYDTVSMTVTTGSGPDAIVARRNFIPERRRWSGGNWNYQLVDMNFASYNDGAWYAERRLSFSR
ncbi:hypothetical protein LTR17_013195 [Elasticomyces elasticus]|nr:hypothetical protein LTR17_013195 [Elasticomyces elasticus]